MQKDQRTYIIKRLLYKSNYRGCKETDLILGNFAKANINDLSDDELMEFDLLLGKNDANIWDWINEYTSIPDDVSVSLIEKIRESRNQ